MPVRLRLPLPFRKEIHNGEQFQAVASTAEGAIMSYPSNKRERFQIGDRKGRKRVAAWFYGDSPPDEDFRRKSIRYHRNTTKTCSCMMMCCNPRKRGELTLQELKFLSSLKD